MAIATATRWVYRFEDGSAAMRELLGGKGSGIAEMTRAGIPVPPGFTITTEACRAFYASGGHLPEGLWDQVKAGLAEVEARTGKKFGGRSDPLLLSVRSGAKFSMPGMMDTVLNLGLNETAFLGLRDATGDVRFALDARRRLIQMYGKTVRGLDGELFEHVLSEARRRAGVESDGDLDTDHLGWVVGRMLDIYRHKTGDAFPEDPEAQLWGAVQAVFRSWNTDRARAYRAHEHIPDDLGTAVNVQAMVFGNLGAGSGTGVAFTRDPNSGEPVLYGDFLVNAQGEDVVAGIRTTEPIAALKSRMPDVHRQLNEYAKALETHYRDMQDVEFTVERGKLYLLQTRTGKRTGEAAVRIAVDLVAEGVISRQEAVLRVEPRQLEQLLHPRVDPAAGAKPISRGVPAAPGAATGAAVFDPDTAQAWGKAGKAVVLVRNTTSPDDVHGMIEARGILTSTGGTLSHAAVVARGMGKPCVVGARDIEVDVDARKLVAGGVTIVEGEVLTIDGGTGDVYKGAVPTVEPAPSGRLQTLLAWADDFRKLEVWANADYPRDAEKAIELGAEGVGLCRTEHMFMEAERLPVVRAMILARTVAARERELAKLLPMQRGDFEGILRVMAGRPVVIRLIDPPLHEFLPSREELIEEVATLRATGRSASRLAKAERLLARVEELHEENPMMGLRGCRLGILFPEITRMQVRAIMEAACSLVRQGVDARPEIMVPLVGTLAELEAAKASLIPVADAVMAETGVKVDYLIGTMIEVPRAALVAGDIASAAEFFSFGTNDLSQLTFGYSRDDAERHFIVDYLERGILKVNPFETIDPAVARLMKLATTEGRAARPSLKVGICGEHGGDPDSIRTCAGLGLDYVSCSPFRIPVARLAAAQAALGEVSSTA